MLRILVLVSGSGTNLEAILEAIEKKELEAEVVAVLSDRPCYALERARRREIPALSLKRGDYLSLEESFRRYSPDLIVLAGYLSILPSSLVEKWQGKMLNIHPSLLPKFGGPGMYGLRVHEAVLAAGEKESGCSLHFVEAKVDAGEIVRQRRVPVFSKDTPEDLQKRVLEQEHILLLEGIQSLQKGGRK